VFGSVSETWGVHIAGWLVAAVTGGVALLLVAVARTQRAGNDRAEAPVLTEPFELGCEPAAA